MTCYSVVYHGNISEVRNKAGDQSYLLRNMLIGSLDKILMIHAGRSILIFGILLTVCS